MTARAEDPPAQLRITGADVGNVLQLLEEKDKLIHEMSKKIEKLCAKVEELSERNKKLQRSKRQHPDNASQLDVMEIAKSKKKKKIVKTATNVTNSFSVKNRFEALEDDGEEPMEDTADETAQTDNQWNNTQGETSQKNESIDTVIRKNKLTQDSPTSRRVPPVVLRNKDKYMQMTKLANTTGINIIKAKTLMAGVAFHPQTELDYRKLVRLFNHQGVEYHTYQLPSEKLLYVVIKGIPEPINANEVKEELIARGFHPEGVSRMRSRKDKRALHMVLVTVPRTEKSIYEIKDILGLIVTVEDQKSSKKINQCHRCQRFGHAQSRCTANPKCVKCAGNHLTSDCNIDKQTPPKCVNCKQQHPASYQGCSAWPKIKPSYAPKNTTMKNSKQTYATVTSNKELNFSSLYENFRIMHSQMLEMTKQLGQMFQANEKK